MLIERRTQDTTAARRGTAAGAAVCSCVHAQLGGESCLSMADGAQNLDRSTSPPGS
jgi:hypothetical protein